MGCLELPFLLPWLQRPGLLWSQFLVVDFTGNSLLPGELLRRVMWRIRIQAVQSYKPVSLPCSVRVSHRQTKALESKEMSAQALHVLHVCQCDDHCYMLNIVLQDAQNDMKTYVLEKTAKETEGVAPPESPSVRRKRKRSAKTKTGIRPRALFQENDDPGAAPRASDADESDHPEVGDDNASEASSPAPSIRRTTISSMASSRFRPRARARPPRDAAGSSRPAKLPERIRWNPYWGQHLPRRKKLLLIVCNFREAARSACLSCCRAK